MNILMIGYGKMGKAIEKIAEKRGHKITYKADNKEELIQISPRDVDVALEFTHPDAAFDNISFCLEHHIKVVSGTTGWLHRFDQLSALCAQLGGTFFHAANFSIGVNIFFKINKLLADIMNSYPDYDLHIEEIHHTEKKDVPSGTAIKLAEDILSLLGRKKSWSAGKTDSKASLDIYSERIDKTPGTHTVSYCSPIDTIEIRHTAHSREGFALGAVLVAEWILDKTGVLHMGDYLDKRDF